jgi:dihydropteroate synthase
MAPTAPHGPPAFPPLPARPPLTPPPPWQLGGLSWGFARPLLLGVLNATPDSFSDGGRYLDPGQAVAHAHALVAEGADMIDVGGASSHPKAPPVPEAEELRRVLPVLERLRRELGVPLSIDTQRPAVAQAAVQAGAVLINDVSGLPDVAMARVAAAHDVPLVITYNNLTLPPPIRAAAQPEAMLSFFRGRIAAAEAAGARRLVLDPGYGFGKPLAVSLAVLRAVPALCALGRPVLVCTSRKGSLGRITGEADPAARVGATVASSLVAVQGGAALVRVHDVAPMRQALQTWRAIATGQVD